MELHSNRQFFGRTISVDEVSTSGTVAAGKVGIQFIFSEDFEGTIDGVDFAGATDAAWEPPALQAGECYSAISYTITAGSARLTTVA